MTRNKRTTTKIMFLRVRSHTPRGIGQRSVWGGSLPKLPRAEEKSDEFIAMVSAVHFDEEQFWNAINALFSLTHCEKLILVQHGDDSVGTD